MLAANVEQEAEFTPEPLASDHNGFGGMQCSIGTAGGSSNTPQPEQPFILKFPSALTSCLGLISHSPGCGGVR